MKNSTRNVVASALTAAVVTGAGTAALAPDTEQIEAAIRADREQRFLMLEDFDEDSDNGDWSLAFERALNTEGKARVIQLGRGIYNFKKPVDICRAIRVMGAGDAATVLQIHGYKTPFTLRFRWDCQGAKLGSGASFSSFSDFTIREANPNSKPDIFRVAFDVNAPARFSRIRFRGFTHFIQADCGAMRDLPPGKHKTCFRDPAQCSEIGDCNAVHIDEVSGTNTEHAAILFQGPDSNAGSVFRSSFVYACRGAQGLAEAVASGKIQVPKANRHLYYELESRTEKRADGSLHTWTATVSPCAALTDSSFLGNTYIANHVANAKLWDPKRKTYTLRYRDYWFDDPKGNQRAVGVGNYAEEGSRSTAGRQAIIVGGFQSGFRGGLKLLDGRLSGATLVSPKIISRPWTLGTEALFMRWDFPGTGDFIYWKVTKDGKYLDALWKNANVGRREHYKLFR